MIHNIKPNEVNPIFEMHYVIAEKILQINGNKGNKEYISIPKSLVKEDF
ncbi:hypothetical protein [Rickettsia oklahomensis]|uniref:Uncharacterized protein n=1 Tax=Rickettsia oklahomensis TaxID=3141789 RepID=A0AAU7BZ66_9RICK